MSLQDRPSAELIDQCVHCGFCLPTCPTYVQWGEEMDSPRGRIYLMKAAVEKRTPIDASYVRHLDACLGCVGCVTACPSGVQYGTLVEQARAQIEKEYVRPPADRLFRSVLLSMIPYPARMRIALLPMAVFGGLLTSLVNALTKAPANIATEGAKPGSRLIDGRFFQRLAALIRLAPPVSWASLRARTPSHTPAVGEERMKVAVLTGCVQQIAFDHVNQATARVLSAEGCSVAAPGAQGCCGALALHAGHADSARRFARHNIDAFERANVDRIVVNAAGCGSAMKEYGQLLGDDPQWGSRARAFSAKVRDVCEVLVELGEPRSARHPIKARVAYHDACHLAHGQGVRTQPRQLLQGIPGLELMVPAESDICCGSAGIYNLVQPQIAADLGTRKVRHLSALTPDLIATGNPGCTLQIAATARERGLSWLILHPVELLDASIRGIDPR